jgi:hypothetical protein
LLKVNQHENSIQKKNKDKSVKVRLTEETWVRLQKKCDEKDIKVSKLIRDLIESYLDFRFTLLPLGGIDDIDKPYESVVISRPMFKEIFEDLPEDKIQELIELDYNIGMKDGKRIFPSMYNSESNMKLSSKQRIKTVDTFIGLLIKYAFSNETRNWFDQIRYEINESSLRIIGKHGNGSNFSTYFIGLLEKIVKNWRYVLKKSKNTFRDNKYFVDLEFIYINQ